MTPQQLHLEAARLGLRLEPRGDKLAVIPADRLTLDFAKLLSEHKASLLAWLGRAPQPRSGSVPPAELALDPNPPRPTPTYRERMIAYVLRQTGDRPGLLAAWLVRRENQYFDGPGRTWDCGLICYAVARDAACWQLRRSEAETLDLIRGCEETSK